MKHFFTEWSRGSGGTEPPMKWLRNLALTAALMLGLSPAFAQTTLLSGTSVGGSFEAASLTASGWSTSQSANNYWTVGTAPGASNGTRSAFITNDGTTNGYNNGSAQANHLWRDFTAPAGENIINLSFFLKGNPADVGYDRIRVYVAPQSVTPAAGTEATSGATQVFSFDGNLASFTQQNIVFGTTSLGSQNFRVIFTWRNDGSVGSNPPYAIDQVNITSSAPSTFTANAAGGLWSSPATWVGGAVPVSGVGHSIVIPSGSVVTVDQAISYRDYTINGVMYWNATAPTTTVNFMSASGDVTIGSTGRFLPYSTAGSGATLYLLGNFTNNGYANLFLSSLVFTGSGNQSLGGSGTYQGNGTKPVIGSIVKQNTGTVTLSQPINLRSMNPLNGVIAGAGNIEFDVSKSQIFGVAGFNGSVTQAVVTNMGAGYAAAPTIGPSGAQRWANASAVTTAAVRVANGQVYVCSVAGTTGATAPSHTSGTATDGTATWLWVGAAGSVGTPLTITALTAGTQYFYGNNLYTCTVAGTPSAASPPVHTSGTATSGTATFQYVGSAAKISLNYDATNQVVRSANITTPGSGYTTTPGFVVVPPATAPTTTALMTLVNYHALFTTATSVTISKSAAASFTGTPSIASTGALGVPTTSNGGRYATAPAVGVTPPNAINLAHLPGFNGGTGYTVAPTAAFTGGTLLATGSAAVTPILANGRVIGITTTGSNLYSAPPTGITFTGGTFTTAASTDASFTTALQARWATFTATLGSNGQINGFTVTNPGYDYTSATLGLPTAGVGEVAATTPTVRPALYNLNVALYTPLAAPTGVDWVTPPATTTAPHDESTNLAGLVPSSRVFNALTLQGGVGVLSLNGNVTLLAAASALTLGGGPINLNGNTLLFQNPGYNGTNSTSVSWVYGGPIVMNYIGTLSRNFPFRATGATGGFQLSVGSGTAPAGGSDITRVRVTQLGAPSGSATGTPACTMMGSKSYQVDVLTGNGFGATTLPTATMAWDASYDVVANNQSIILCQSNTGLSSGWAARSAAGTAGNLAATGTRTTATTGNGPIVFASTMYFGWGRDNAFVYPAPLNYAVSRTTGNAYTSIAPVNRGGNGTGLDIPGITQTSNNDDVLSSTVSLAGTTFQYQGNAVTGVKFCTNGWLTFNTAETSGTLSNNMGGTAVRSLVAAYWDDIYHYGAYSGSYYSIDGTLGSGTAKITFEWYKYSFFSASGPELYFQVVLDENGNKISINYGNMQSFNGTFNRRHTYAMGLNGSFISPFPQPGEVMALQHVNTTAFGEFGALVTDLGANAQISNPEPRSSYTFTPGTYVPPVPFAPVVSAPSNDDPAGAITYTPMPTFPSNIAWHPTDDRSNFYTLKGATQSSQPVCGGPTNPKDVWFKFVASDPNVQVRVYPSAGMTPVIEVLDPSLNPISPAQCNVGTIEGSTALTTVLNNLAVGSAYYVRVYNKLTGVTAVANPIIGGGSLLAVTSPTGGSNYPSGIATSPITEISVTGGGGKGAVLSASNVSGSLVFGLSQGGTGYTSTPTVTINSPDIGITGEFGLVIYAAAPNDEPSTATLLTNLNNATCVANQNSITGVYTGAASASVINNVSCGGAADDDVWYTFIANATGFTEVTVNAAGGLFDPVVQIFRAAGSANDTTGWTSIQCLNATGASGIESILLPTITGRRYYVRVYHSGVGSVTSSFNICVKDYNPPAGFWCGTAANIGTLPFASGAQTTVGLANLYGTQASTCSSTYGTTNNDYVYKLDLSNTGLNITQPIQLNFRAVNTSGTFNIGWFLKGSAECDAVSTQALACAVSGTTSNTASGDVAFGGSGLPLGVYYIHVTYGGAVSGSAFTFDVSYSCPTVAGLASSGTTATTASLTWQAQDMYSSYNVEYKLVSAGTWTAWSGNPLSTTNVTLSPLTSASSYQFRVTAGCNGPATATASTPFNFNTLCPTFTAPLSQNFNSGIVLPNLPVCWSRLVQNLPGASVITTLAGSPVSGNQVAMYNGLSSNASGQLMLISPQLTDINNLANPNRLSFSARAATVPAVTNSNPCNTSTVQYPTSTVTPLGNTVTSISTCNYTTEYSTVTLVQDSAYQITISLNKFMTITNSTGTIVYQTGQSPQTFVAPASGSYRLYWSDGLAPNCGGVSSCHTTTIQKVALPESPTTSSILVGTITDPTDPSTFTQKASVDITGTHTTYTLDFYDYTGSDQYLAFKHGESTLGSNKTIYMEDFSWTAIPPCAPPLGLTVSNVTVGSAQLSWNTVFDAVNGYAVQYQVAGDLTWTDAPGSPIAFGTNNVVVNSLDPGTAYNWRIAAVCGTGNSGYASGPAFSTLCNPVSVPYTEGFESILVNNQLPNCVTTTNLNTRTFTYKLPVGTPSNSMGAPRTDRGFAVISSANTAPGDYIFTPAISLTGNTAYQLRFWYRRDAFTATTNNLTAWFGTAATGAGMSTQIGATVNLNSGTAGAYQLFTANFTPATDGIYYVGLRRLTGTPATGYVSIDDISIDFPSTCADPSGVILSGVPTTTSLAVNWTENGTATAWDIEYGPSPYNFTGTPTITGTTSKPYTFTGLSANTMYDVRVRARCNSSNLSDWSATASVKTGCGTITTFPWNYSFEDVTTLNVLANCDATYPATLSTSSGIAVYPTAPVTPITTGSTSYNRGPRTGNAFAAHYYGMGNTADSSVYFTPMFQLTSGTFYKFSMYYRSDAIGGWPRLMCSYGPNQSVVGMLPISGARANNIPNTATSYTLLEGYFSPATSGNYCIGISSIYAPSPWHLSFDDLRLEVTPCLPPSAFSVNVGSTSVTWSATNPTAGFVPTNYQIEYNTTGVFTGNPNATLTPTNTALSAVNTLVTSGLTPGTRYYYRYRGNCGANQSSWSVSASFVTKPVNDDCSAAITVTPSTSIICSSTTSGSTAGGTASLGTALNASTQCTATQSNPDDDVWYKFVATATQHVITVFSSSGFDAVLEVRNSTAGACPGIAPVLACANTTLEGGAESVTLNTVVGNTYYVRVWSATTNAATVTPTSGLPITTTFNLCVSTPSVLAGATCATAITVNTFPYNQNYTTQGGDDNIGLQNSCGGTYGTGEDIVYKLVIPTAGTRIITLRNLNGTGYIGWFLKSSTNCSATNLGSNLSCAVSGATDVASGFYYFVPGTYYLVVDYDAVLGPAYSNYNISIVNAPANDEWNASAVSYLSPAFACNTISGSVANATPSAGVPTNFTCGGNSDDDVWYRFVAIDNTHLLTLTGNTFVDRLEVFSNNLGSLTSLGCAQASSGTALLTLPGLTIGNTYYVRVYSSATGPATNTALNNFTLCLQRPIANDEICGAVTLTAGAFSNYTSGNNQFATNSATIAGSCANFGANFNKDLWYRVQAPADGVLAINVVAGTFGDHDMQVWATSNQTNPCSGTLTSVACDLSSGVGSEPYLYLTGLTANNWYFIQVRSNPSVTGGGSFLITATNAVNWTGSVSTAYENPGNWFNGDAVPSLGSNIAIPATATKPVVNSSPTVNTLFMAEGSLLTVNLNNLFKVRNNINMNTNATGMILGDGRLQFTAGNTQTINGTLVVNNAELAKSGGSVGFGSNSKLMVYGLFTPTTGTMNTSSNLVIASNLNGYTALNGGAIFTNGQIATGTATVNGNVVVERRIITAGYHHLANPVSSSSTVAAQYGDDLTILGPNGYIYDVNTALPQPPTFPNLWFYEDSVINSPTRPGWVNSAGYPYASGRGIFGLIPTPRVLEAVGSVANGNISIAVRRGPTNAAWAPRGFNLLGNPYATNLNLVAFLQQNAGVVENTIYVWNASINNYATASINVANSTVSWTNAPVNNATRLPHSQAFFLRKITNGESNVTFTNAMRATSSSQTFLNSTLANARFSIRNGAYGDEAVFVLDPQANEGADRGDATKLTSLPTKSTMLYSVSGDGENLAINSVPEFTTDMMIPLGVVVGETGSVTFEATELTAFDAMPNVYLYDAVLNKEVDLRAQSTYSVNLTEGNVGSRFFITFESKVKASAAAAAGLNIYANDNKVFVAFPVETATATIEIMNVLGQTLSTANVSAFKGLKEVSVDGYSAGNYLVKVTADGRITSQKVFIGRK